MRRNIFCLLVKACGVLLIAQPLFANSIGGKNVAPSPPNKIIKATVTVIIDKLPADKRQKMATFDQQVQRYIESHDYIEEDYVAPFQVGVQLFLEDYPYNGEDRYRCSILLNGPDVQYSDKRARFAFQQNEQLSRNQGFSAIGGLIDFYLCLVIGNELDKYDELAGTHYFEKARALVEQGKFGQFFEGWDRRDELMQSIFSENYKKFREMKNYYFYGLWGVQNDAPKQRSFVKQAIRQLKAVLTENRDNLAAQQFIDAHHQEIVDLFKDSGDPEVFKTLKALNPDRAELYDEYIE
jgi:hypothetical protein